MLVNWNMCPKLIPPKECFAAGRAYMRLSSMVSQVALNVLAYRFEDFLTAKRGIPYQCWETKSVLAIICVYIIK